MTSIRKLIGLLLALCQLAGGSSIAATSAGNDSRDDATNVYYVSTTGSDLNDGSLSAPFRTLAKGVSVLLAGDTLIILPGTYNEILNVSQNGDPAAFISIYGRGAIVDLRNANSPGVRISGSYIRLDGLEVRNTTGICVDLRGNYVTVDGLTVHECLDHGINTDSSSHVNIMNNTVYRAVLSNRARNTTSGWGSGIKVRLASYVLIQGNTIFNNYGEGIGSRGTNITVRGNTAYDNYSVNLYANSENATFERNFVYCTPNSGFERDGKPAGGIGMAEEYFVDWGARLINARVVNNIVTRCKSGVRYGGADPRLTNGGLKYATIAYNTLYGSVDSAISIVYGSAQTADLIANNIVWQAENKLVYIDSYTGLTFQNNLWKSLPPLPARGPGDRMVIRGF